MSTAKTQEKRPGYKMTKLGWIPEDWEVKSLGDLGETINGLTYSPNDISENGILVLRSSNVQNRVITYDDNVYVNTETFHKTKAGDILICVRNGSKSLIGKSALIDRISEGTAFGAFMSIYRSSLNNYLFQIFGTDMYYRSVHKNLGATINSINGKDLLKFKIPLPPLTEQKKIAEILGTWDDAIAKTKDLIAQLKSRKKGLMQQLLSGKTRLPGYNENWKEVRYEDILEKVNRAFEWDDDRVYDLISVRRRSGGIFRRVPLYGHQIKVKNLRNVKEGDFLFSKMQIVHGASAYVAAENDNTQISGSYISVVSKKPKVLDVRYLDWFSKTKLFYHHSFISSYGVHIEKMTFNYNLFVKEKISIPSLNEQQAIIQILDTSDQEIQKQEEKLAQLQATKKGLMQQLLTGEVRVN